MSERLISRRGLLKHTPLMLAIPVALAHVGCNTPEPVRQKKTDSKPTPTLTRIELEAQTIRHQILAELNRLSAPHPEESIIRKVYRGRLSEVSPIFPNNPKLRLANPTHLAAGFDFSDHVTSLGARFRYRLNNNGSVKDYKTLDHTDITFFFPPTWLRLSDETKEFVMDKEARNLKVYDDFARHIILPTYKSQGTLEKIDPNVTEIEIARTFAMDQLNNNSDLLKIYDYYGYLAKFEDLAQFEEAGSKIVLQELDANSNIIEIYKKANDLNIPFRKLEVGSLEFLKLAFGGNNTPWVRLVLDPSTPGPYKS